MLVGSDSRIIRDHVTCRLKGVPQPRGSNLRRPIAPLSLLVYKSFGQIHHNFCRAVIHASEEPRGVNGGAAWPIYRCRPIDYLPHPGKFHRTAVYLGALIQGLRYDKTGIRLAVSRSALTIKFYSLALAAKEQESLSMKTFSLAYKEVKPPFPLLSGESLG
ncbi:hypothetical protein GQ54DRAFT_70202 [Martensiomyces pterosporus]|nr:hypothetical protein GQ54DRAFT_70202 [Martensiomyces pterosporus]